MTKYKVKSGIEYLGKRAEVGDIVTDIPAKSIKWLRECGAIELVDGDANESEEVIETSEDAE
jgi:hypothetical protein